MEPITVSKVKKPEVITLVARNCNLLEPFAMIWFKDGKPVEVAQITSWMQIQIKAGLIERV